MNNKAKASIKKRTKNILDCELFSLSKDQVNSDILESIERLRDDLNDLNSIPLIIEDIFYAAGEKQYGAYHLNSRLYPIVEYFLIKFRAAHDHLGDTILNCSTLDKEASSKLSGSFPAIYRSISNKQTKNHYTPNLNDHLDNDAIQFIKGIHNDYLRSFNYLRNQIIHKAANVTISKISNQEIWFTLEDSITEEEYDTFPHYADEYEKHKINFSTMFECEMKHLSNTLNTLYKIVNVESEKKS